MHYRLISHHCRRWVSICSWALDHGRLTSNETLYRSLTHVSTGPSIQGVQSRGIGAYEDWKIATKRSWKFFDLASVRPFCSKPSDDESDNEAETGDVDASGAAEVKKLDEDAELQANVDEEKEAQEHAEEIAKAMGDAEQSSDSDSDSSVDSSDSEDDDEGVSVLHQVIDAESLFPQRTEHKPFVRTTEGPSQRTTETETTEVPLSQLASERRRKLFWEYIENPNKKKHLLNEILSPKSLDETEEFGIDKADMVRAEDFAEFLVDVRTSQKAVKSGAILRYRAMMVVGNFQGIVGFGLGKSSTIQGGVDRARRLALKNLIAIPLYRQHTIYEAASAKVTATKVLMWPRSRGFGVVANPILYGCCDLIGVRDISIKVIGSKNRFNMIKAFFAALESIRSALEIAEEKGIYMRELCLFRPPRTLVMK